MHRSIAELPWIFMSCVDYVFNLMGHTPVFLSTLNMK